MTIRDIPECSHLHHYILSTYHCSYQYYMLCFTTQEDSCKRLTPAVLEQVLELAMSDTRGVIGRQSRDVILPATNVCSLQDHAHSEVIKNHIWRVTTGHRGTQNQEWWRGMDMKWHTPASIDMCT